MLLMSAFIVPESIAQAKPPASRHPDQTTPEAALIRQKMVLLESYLKSDAIAEADASNDDAARSLLADARRLLREAADAFAARRLEEAGKLIDLAIRHTATATAKVNRKRSGTNVEQSSRRYAKYRAQISNLLNRFDEIVLPSSAVSEKERTRRSVKSAFAHAETLTRSERYEEANAILVGAYRTVAQAIAKHTKGQVVVSALDFDSPQEEFEYERRRNETYTLLVRKFLVEKERFPRGLRRLVDQKFSNSQKLATDAERHAGAKEFAKAIDVMERSTSQLIWVLQAGGVPIAN